MTKSPTLNLEEQINHLRQEASILAAQGRIDAALSMLDSAETAIPINSEPKLMGLVWRGRANILHGAGFTERGLNATAEAVKIYREHGSEFDIAVARVIDVYGLGITQHYQQAVQLAEQIIPVFKNFPRGLAAVYTNLGQIHEWQWKLPEAQDAHEKAILIWEQLGLFDRVVKTKHNLAMVVDRLEDHVQARTIYEEVLAYFEAEADAEMQVKAHLNIARMDRRLGNLQAALDRIGRSQTLLQEPMQGLAGNVAFFEGSIRLQLNQLRAAEQLLGEAIDVFTQLNWQVDNVAATIDLATVFTRQNRPIDALSAYQRVESQIIAAETPLLFAIVQANQSKLNLQLGNIQTAQVQAEAAQSAFEQHGLQLRMADMLCVQAECKQAQDLEAARQLYAEALALGESNLTIQAKSWAGIGTIHKKAGEFADATTAFTNALDRLEKLRGRIDSHANRASYFDDKQEIMTSLLASIQQQAGRERQLFEWIERLKAGALADLLASVPPDVNLDETAKALLAERDALRREMDLKVSTANGIGGMQTEMALAQRSRSALRSFQSSQSEKAAALRKRLELVDADLTKRTQSLQWREGDGGVIRPKNTLPANTLLINYFTIDDQLFALTASNQEGDIEQHALDVSLTHVMRMWGRAARDVRRPVKAGTRSERAKKSLNQLFKLLFAPLETRLGQFSTLVISPIRELSAIPFAGLFDGERYAIERWQIQKTPSLTILARCQQRPKATQPALLVGYPSEENSADYLPAVSAEIDTIHHQLPQADVLFGANATVENVVSRLAARSAIHFAGHIVCNSKTALESGIPLADGGWLRASDLYVRQGAATGSTIVLSGCDSGRAKTQGWDILGLTTSFLYAGASGVVSTLWKIDDAASMRLIAHFYAAWQNQKSAAALRSAQLALLQNEDYQHPYFWAAFGLIGDSRKLV